MTATQTVPASPWTFLPAGDVSLAERSRLGPPVTPAVLPRMRRGLRYQHAVESAVLAWADLRRLHAEVGPWFRFVGSTRPVWRWCQPDILVDRQDDGPLVVLEVKLQFEPLAWRQLTQLYRQVLTRAFGGRPVHVGVICGSFDPAVGARLPVPVVLTLDEPGAWLDERLTHAGDSLAVLQWRKPSADDLSG